MEVATVAGLGIKWISMVRTWLLDRSQKKKGVLTEVNRILSQDPEALAQLYVEPDFQPFNPANLQYDEPDDEDHHFRVPAYKWLNSFLVKPRRRDGRHVAFILSDAGMGKSSLLAMLRMSGALSSWQGIRFRLFKLGDSTLHEIGEIDHPFETVLLLDSLDEDPKAFGRIEDRLIEILKATSQFRQVIITSRTQFFPIQNRYERHGALIKIGGFTCKMIFLALFSERQIDTYLEKLYATDAKRRIKEAKRVILGMRSLRMRPMLLAHVEDLMEMRRRDDISEWTPFRTHGALVDAWLDREERKPRSKVRAGELRAACHVMAISLQKQMGFLHSGEGGRTISPRNLAALLHRAKVGDAIREVREFGGRSLLNLNSEGDYRFAHYSIQEFLVVDHMARHPEKMAEYTESIRYSDELVLFLVSWSQQAPRAWRAYLDGADLSKADLSKASLPGASLSGANLAGTRLRATDLRGADLGRAGLEKADLSSANLTDANLSGSVLADASLTSAKLANAKLAEADLRDADLTGADLSNVELRGVDLRWVSGLTATQLSDVRIVDERTFLPPTIKRPSSWPPQLKVRDWGEPQVPKNVKFSKRSRVLRRH